MAFVPLLELKTAYHIANVERAGRGPACCRSAPGPSLPNWAAVLGGRPSPVRPLLLDPVMRRSLAYVGHRQGADDSQHQHNYGHLQSRLHGGDETVDEDVVPELPQQIGQLGRNTRWQLLGHAALTRAHLQSTLHD